VAGMPALAFALLIAVAGLPLYLIAKISKKSRSNRRTDLNPES
jgi:hypothetical protein